MILLGLLSTGTWLNSAEAQRAQNFEQRQAWELGCYNKNAASCDAVARHWDAVAQAGGERGRTVEQSFVQKMRWAEKGCAIGGQYSCDALGWASEHGVESRERDTAAAHRYYRTGCDNGAYISCNNYAGTFFYGIGVAQDRQRGLEIYERACAVGNPYACKSLENARREMGTEEMNSVCMAGDALACYRIALLQSHGESPDPAKASTYFARTCFDLSDPHGCLLYGVFLSDARDQVAENWQSIATSAFEKSCAIGKTEICDTLEETGTENYWKMTYAVMKQSCDIGLVPACWGIVERLSQNSWLVAAQYADKGCQLGAPELCHNAGVLYLNHPNVVGDPYYNAVGAFQAGCEKGYQPSCDGQTYAFNKSQIWRDVTFGSGQSGFEKFMSDLATGLGQAAAMGVPSSAQTVPSSPSLTTNTNSTVQDNRDFQNAINATNNIGTGYNSTCPASNPYC